MPSADSAESDRRHMAEALALARAKLGLTTPNPAVGCVIVRGGDIVGRGVTGAGGRPHAETVAIANAGPKARGATAYVTLEPCAHQGETSACARVLIQAAVKRVVVGCVDPYPPVRGRGVRILREGGILVSVGMMEPECRRLNEGFFTRVTRGRPFVMLKLAASLDGRIAASGGDSKWVSSPASRALVHRWRRECDAVLAGAGTIIADDPRLTCRIPGGRDPLRIIVDSRLRSPADARVFRQRSPALTLLVTSRANLERARRRYASPRVEAMAVSGRGDELALDELMYEMGKRKLNRVLIEGGAHTAGSALRYGIVDRIAMFIAPRIVGAGLPAIEGLATGRMRDALALDGLETSQVGEDLLVQAIVRRTTRARRGGPNRAAPVKKAGLEKQPAR